MRELSSGQGLDALAGLESRLASALTPPGVQLGEVERHTIGAIAAMLQQAFALPGIEPAVRARLWKLAPPLALLALQDDGQLDVGVLIPGLAPCRPRCATASTPCRRSLRRAARRAEAR